MRVAKNIQLFLAWAAAIVTFFAASAVFASHLPWPPGPSVKLAVNPHTGKVYRLNESANTVTVLDPATGATTTTATGPRPYFIAVNPVTNRVFIVNAGDSTLTVLDGATDTQVTGSPFATGSTGPIAVNPVTNIVYIVRFTGTGTDEVTYFNANANTWYTIATDSYQPISVAVNPVTNRIYVAHYSTGDVRPIDGTYNSLVLHPAAGDTGIGVWSHPFAVAVNPVTNKVYSIGEDSRGPIVIIDGATRATTFPAIASGHAVGPKAIAVNPVTNKAYALFQGEVIVIDASGALTYIPVATGSGAASIAVDTRSDMVYVAGNDGTLTTIRGSDNSVTTTTVPAGTEALAVDPLRNKVYAFNGTLTTLTGTGTPGTNPLRASVTSSGTSFAATDTLSVSVTNGFTPSSLPANRLYYQFDSSNGAFQRVTSTSTSFGIPLAGLADGTHTVHFYAADGQDAPLYTGGTSPLTGTLESFTFTVGSTKPTPTVSLAGTPNPSTFGQSVSFTVSVSGSAGTATGTVALKATSTTLCTITLSGGAGSCSAVLPQPGSNSVVAEYAGDTNYASAASSSVAFTANKATPTLSLASSANPSTAGQTVTFTATIAGPSTVRGPSGTMDFLDGATVISGCSAKPVNGAGGSTPVTVTCATSALSTGTHSITARYNGDTAYNATTSSALSQTVNAAALATPTVGLSSSANPSTAGQAVTFLANVSGSAGTPTGSVTFAANGSTIGGCASVALAAGSASCTTSTLAAGTHTITASYSGNASYNPGTSAGLTQTVNGGSGSTPVNVALASSGATISASSSWNTNFPASAVINGDRTGANYAAGGVWADGTYGAFPDSVEITFSGGAKSIDRVVVYSVQDNYTSPAEPTDTMTFSSLGITAFTVQGWNGSSWVTLAAVSGNNRVKRTVTFTAASVSKVRIQVDNAMAGLSRLVEVEAWTAGTSTPPAEESTNVALASAGTVASASSSWSANFPVAAINNGERAGANYAGGGVWADGTYGAFPDWVQLDFGTTRTIDRVVVYSVQDNYSSPSEPTDAMTFSSLGVTDFDVQAWNGASWSTVASVRGNNRVKRTVTFTAVATSRIRIHVVSALANLSRVAEVEAWTQGGTTTDPTDTNVALATAGASATASSTWSANFPVGAIINGERAGTNYAGGGVWADGTYGAFPDAVQVDFGASRTISRVVLFSVQDNYSSPSEPTDTMTFSSLGVTDFDVDAWNGTSWVALGTVRGNNLVKRTVEFPAVTASSIRITVRLGQSGLSRITEVEAWGH